MVAVYNHKHFVIFNRLRNVCVQHGQASMFCKIRLLGILFISTLNSMTYIYIVGPIIS